MNPSNSSEFHDAPQVSHWELEETEIEKLFQAAIALDNATQRDVFLDVACQGRPQLREMLRELLAYDSAQHAIDRVDFLALSNSSQRAASPGSTAVQNTAMVAQPGAEAAARQWIGSYELIEVIGEGGMGTVWRAQQSGSIQREVALKLIRPGLDTASIKRRFEAERQSLAQMDHLHIARIFDAGEDENGQPFFAMELVRGVPITRYCDAARLTIRQRLELFLQVCSAVQHAHQKLTIHRDLKPENILVTEFDGLPVCKIIDFGLAKALQDAPLAGGGAGTGFNVILGTPLYMAPEQIGPSASGADTRTDQYALGVILYELLTGRPTIDRERLKSASMDEVRWIIQNEEPISPSTLLSSAQGRQTVAVGQKIDHQRLVSVLRGDLDWIVMKTLDKQPSRRYESVSGLARDIQRYLNHQPVEASPPSTLYRVRKFVQRYRWQVVAAQLLLVTLVVGIIGTTWGLMTAESQRHEAEAAADAADKRAEQARLANLEADHQRQLAEDAELATLESYRASTDDAIAKLILSKDSLTRQERAYLEGAIERWQVFANRHGEDPRSRSIAAEGHFYVGNIWSQLGESNAAEGEYELAIEISGQLAGLPDVDGMHRYSSIRYRRNYARQLNTSGKKAEAERAVRESCRDAGNLASAFPTNTRYLQEWVRNLETLGKILTEQGIFQEAMTVLDDAVMMQTGLVNSDPQSSEYHLGLAMLRLKLAIVEEESGKEKAEETYRQALGSFEQLEQNDPGVLIHRSELATCLSSLGQLLASKGKVGEAEALLRRAIENRSALVADFPSVRDYQAALAGSHNDLGWFLRDQLTDAPAGIMELRTAVAIQRRLVTDYPNEVGLQHRLSRFQFTLGYLLYTSAQLDAARAEYLQAMETLKAIESLRPGNLRISLDIGSCYCHLGQLELEASHFMDSLEWYSQAIEIGKPLLLAQPGSYEMRELLRNSFAGRARVKAKLDIPSEADWNEALNYEPKSDHPQSRLLRVGLLIEAERFGEARPELESLSHLSHWNRVEWYDLACNFALLSQQSVGQQQADEERSIEMLRQAVSAGFQDVDFMRRDTDLTPLREREDFASLIKNLESQQLQQQQRKPREATTGSGQE